MPDRKIYWACALIPIANALVSAGFSIALLRNRRA